MQIHGFVNKMKAAPDIQLGYNKTVFPDVMAGSGLCVPNKAKSWKYTLGSFKLQFSLGFVTSCYVIMNISIAWTIDKLKIT